jgi:hypothetical protein
MINKNLFTTLFFLVVISLSINSFAQGPKAQALARRAEAPVKIDGDLDDPAWQNAVWQDKFVQRTPHNGAEPSERTSFAVLFDDHSIYFAIRCETSGRDSVVTRLTRRDRGGDFDLINLTLSPREDERTGFTFQFNPDGVKLDMIWFGDSTDVSWDAIWHAETRIEDKAWTAEIEIPLDQLRYTGGKKTWGLQVARWISSLQESSSFNSIPTDISSYLAACGQLTGVEEIPEVKTLSATPEVYLSYRDETENYGGAGRPGFNWGAGGYAKVGLTSDLILDLALTPDFGQVEVDDVFLNLTAYEIQLPEKRPFFLEGSGLFNTPIQLFYSRRIGAPPPEPYYESYEYVKRWPKETTILSAARLTGRSESGVSYGIIDAVLMPTDYQIRNAETGLTESRLAAPWTNTTIMRVSAEHSSTANVGVLATALNPDETNGSYTGGVDWNLLTKDREYAFRGQVAGSKRSDGVLGQEASQGGALHLQLGREGGEHLRLIGFYELFGPGFDSNDLGFSSRDDLHHWYSFFSYQQVEPQGPFMQYYISAEPQGQFNFDGLNLGQHFRIFFVSAWKNNWWSEIAGRVTPQHFDDWETRGGPPLKRPFSQSVWGWVQTPENLPVGAFLMVNWESRPFGSMIETMLSAQVRLGRVELEFGPNWEHVIGDQAYVDTLVNDDQEEMTVVGRRDMDSLELTLKGTFVILRDLTFQMNSQLLVAAADYNRYERLLDDSSTEQYDYPDEYADFSYTDLRLQALLRWEYLPGCALYVVYTHFGFSEFYRGGPSLSDSFGDLAEEEREHNFMIKLSHRFG